METTNKFEQHNRQIKAVRLADTISKAFDGRGIPEAEVAQFTEAQWALAAEAAGTTLPSEKTRALVRQSLRVREQIARKVDVGRETDEDATTAADVFAKGSLDYRDDPFDGLGR